MLTPQNSPVSELPAWNPESTDPDIHKPVTVLRTAITNLHESVSVRWRSSAVIYSIGGKLIGNVKQVSIASVGCVESLRTLPGLFSTITRLEIGQNASVR